ncbi:MAG: phosphopantetheine-binding protein [Acidobacteriota bacterium]
MDRETILRRVVEIIENTTGEQATTIDATTLFVEDLGLDSLSLLEVGVDVDYEFRLNLPEEELQALHSVGEVLDKVLAHHRGGTAAASTDLAEITRVDAKAPMQETGPAEAARIA